MVVIMSTQQPEALRLAERLENHFYCTIGEMDQAAAELRRLHSVNAELLEALKYFVDFPEDTFDGNEDFAFTMTVRMKLMREARSAIAKAQE
jgi:hypothetical protein